MRSTDLGLGPAFLGGQGLMPMDVRVLIWLMVVDCVHAVLAK